MGHSNEPEKSSERGKSILEEIKKEAAEIAKIASSIENLEDEPRFQLLSDSRKQLSALLVLREFVSGKESEFSLSDALCAVEFPEVGELVEARVRSLVFEMEEADEPYADGQWQWGQEDDEDKNKADGFFRLIQQLQHATGKRTLPVALLKNPNLSVHKKTMLLEHVASNLNPDILAEHLDLERDEAIKLYFNYHLTTPYVSGEEFEGPAKVYLLVSEASEDDRELMEGCYVEAFGTLVAQGFYDQAAELATEFVIQSPDKAKAMVTEEVKPLITPYIQKWIRDGEDMANEYPEDAEDYRQGIEKVKPLIS